MRALRRASGTGSPQAAVERAAAARRPQAAGAECTKCSDDDPAELRFCPNCGHRVVAPITFEGETRVGPRPSSTQLDAPPKRPTRSTMMFGGVMQTARAKLTLIRGDGEDGVSFTLAGVDHLAGRGDVPDLVPRRSVPVADARELPLREQPARRARRGLAQRRLHAHQRHGEARARHDGPRRRAGALGATVAPSRGRARHRGHVLLAEHAPPGGPRDRPAAARRPSGWVYPPRPRHRHDRPRGQRHQLPRRPVHLRSPRRAAAEPAACYR